MMKFDPKLVYYGGTYFGKTDAEVTEEGKKMIPPSHWHGITILRGKDGFKTWKFRAPTT